MAGVSGREGDGGSTSLSRLSASIGAHKSSLGVTGEGGDGGGTVGACWGCPMMYTALLWTGPAILAGFGVEISRMVLVEIEVGTSNFTGSRSETEYVESLVVVVVVVAVGCVFLMISLCPIRDGSWSGPRIPRQEVNKNR